MIAVERQRKSYTRDIEEIKVGFRIVDLSV